MNEIENTSTVWNFNTEMFIPNIAKTTPMKFIKNIWFVFNKFVFIPFALCFTGDSH